MLGRLDFFVFNSFFMQTEIKLAQVKRSSDSAAPEVGCVPLMILQDIVSLFFWCMARPREPSRTVLSNVADFTSQYRLEFLIWILTSQYRLAFFLWASDQPIQAILFFCISNQPIQAI